MAENPTEWAKQLLEMIPRDAEGQQITKRDKLVTQLAGKSDGLEQTGRFEEHHRRDREKDKDRSREKDKSKDRARKERKVIGREDFAEDQERTSGGTSARLVPSFMKRKSREVKGPVIKAPSIGLDEKLKKLNTRVKGFLNTNPTFSIAPLIPHKFRQENKRNAHTAPNDTNSRGLSINMLVVDDLLKTFEDETQEPVSDKGDGSDSAQETGMIFSSTDDVHPKDTSSRGSTLQKERRQQDTRIIAMHISRLDALATQQAEEVASLNETCTELLSSSKNCALELTERATQFRTGVSRVMVFRGELEHNIGIIKTHLDSVRTAAASCSEQIKQLDINVQKVQRARHASPTDAFLKLLSQVLLVVVSLFYFVTKVFTHKRVSAEKPSTKTVEESTSKIRRNSSGIFTGDSAADDATTHTKSSTDQSSIYNEEVVRDSVNSSGKDKKMHLAFQNLEAMSQQIHKLQQMELQDL